MDPGHPTQSCSQSRFPGWLAITPYRAVRSGQALLRIDAKAATPMPRCRTTTRLPPCPLVVPTSLRRWDRRLKPLPSRSLLVAAMICQADRFSILDLAWSYWDAAILDANGKRDLHASGSCSMRDEADRVGYVLSLFACDDEAWLFAQTALGQYSIEMMQIYRSTQAAGQGVAIGCDSCHSAGARVLGSPRRPWRSAESCED